MQKILLDKPAVLIQHSLSILYITGTVLGTGVYREMSKIRLLRALKKQITHIAEEAAKNIYKY